jgi:hypothetical protein
VTTVLVVLVAWCALALAVTIAWAAMGAPSRRRRAWDAHTAQALAVAARRHPTAPCPDCGQRTDLMAQHRRLWHDTRRVLAPEDRADWGAR